MKGINPNYSYLKEHVPTHRYTLLQGGTRSGKTYAIIYYIIWLCTKYEGVEIDIIRDTYTSLKSTVWKDFKQVLMECGLYKATSHNKTDKIYVLNDNIINYYGADDPTKIHGRSRDILWVNECNQLKEETIDQLFPRTRGKIIMDYNPALPQEHWLDKYIEDSPPIITTYRDNPHLTSAQVTEIERRKNNRYWWQVYGTGERAKPIGVIFENWNEGDFDESLPSIYGLDFGFSPDPTALCRIAIKDDKVYIKEELYKTELSYQNISDILESRVGKTQLIVADSAEKRMVSDLSREGFNIVPTRKWAGSVIDGIRKMQDFNLIVTPDSYNVKKEMNSYIFHDKKSDIPKDEFNHAIDAIRYAFMDLVGATPMFFG